ncbi:protein lifeguard 2 [Sorex araneus]|uniref:protein lifeguard 2 n=1 Tax=Sorex araneus TaxID=42254 RepID=UPI00243353D8|nr:protein lifeguard 2 [Sorex araneus]
MVAGSSSPRGRSDWGRATSAAQPPATGRARTDVVSGRTAREAGSHFRQLPAGGQPRAGSLQGDPRRRRRREGNFRVGGARAARPQNTPKTKRDETGDSFVVSISEDTTTDITAANAFSDERIRKDFIAKVFFILSIQLMITGAIVSIFVLWNKLRFWVRENPWFTYALLPLFFTVFILLACCGKLRRQVPANYILLIIFTILQGLLLGAVSVFYQANEILWATATTALMTMLLTLFALQTKWDFTLLNGMLFVLVSVLLIYGIILIFVKSFWLHLLYSALGTLIFSLYLVMDVQLMVGGRHHHHNLNPEEYVFAALNIYMDIINLFLFILNIIHLGH